MHRSLMTMGKAFHGGGVASLR